MNFDVFHPFTTKKTDDRTLLFFGACCKRGFHLYTTTAPSCCIPASYCHLLNTLQTMSVIVVNLQENRAVFRIFIALLIFSFDSPTYVLINDVKHWASEDALALSIPLLPVFCICLPSGPCFKCLSCSPPHFPKT